MRIARGAVLNNRFSYLFDIFSTFDGFKHLVPDNTKIDPIMLKICVVVSSRLAEGEEEVHVHDRCLTTK